MAVFNFGSINIDYIYGVDHFVAPGETLASTHFQAVLGGKGANQSVALARANCAVKHIGTISVKDKAQIDIMHQSGVDISKVQLHESLPSGHAIIQVTPEAENAIILFAGANHSLTQTRIEAVLASAQPDDWILLQNETNAIAEIIASAHAKSLKIAFNPAPMQDYVKSLPLAHIDLLFVNEVEAMQLTETKDVESAKAQLIANYPDLQIILTLGKAGVVAFTAGETIALNAFEVDAIDTTAAGDTFVAYTLAMIQQDYCLEDALRTACAAAALAVTKSGAVPSIPLLSEVQQFLDAQ